MLNCAASEKGCGNGERRTKLLELTPLMALGRIVLGLCPVSFWRTGSSLFRCLSMSGGGCFWRAWVLTLHAFFLVVVLVIFETTPNTSLFDLFLLPLFIGIPEFSLSTFFCLICFGFPAFFTSSRFLFRYWHNILSFLGTIPAIFQQRRQRFFSCSVFLFSPSLFGIFIFSERTQTKHTTNTAHMKQKNHFDFSLHLCHAKEKEGGG